MSLPIELWHKVFHHATSITDSKDLIFPSRSTTFSSTPSGPPFSYKESITTKLTLSTVSKLWRALTIELLFKNIVIRHVRSLAALFSAIEMAAGNGNGMTRGWWTQSIEFQLEDCPCTSAEYEDVMETMCKIIANCPRLISFTDGTTRSPSGSYIIPAISATCFQTLQHVQWNSDTCGPSVMGLETLARDCPRLQSLRIASRTYGQGWDTNPLPLVFPDLRKLDLFIVDDGELICSHASAWTISSLTHLVLRVDAANSLSTPSITSFLDAHGTNLTSLDVAVSIPMYFLPVDLDAILCRCTVLESLTLDSAVAAKVITLGSTLSHPMLASIRVRDPLPRSEGRPRGSVIHAAKSFPLERLPALREVVVLPHGEQILEFGPGALPQWKAVVEELYVEPPRLALNDSMFDKVAAQVKSTFYWVCDFREILNLRK